MNGSAVPVEWSTRRAYVLEAKYELLKLVRMPVYAIPSIAFPVMFYALFGLVFGGRSAGSVSMSTYLIATYGAFGVIGAALFGFGVGVAVERGQGWMLLKRATPMPPLAFFTGKLFVCTLFSAAIVLLLMALGILAGGVRLPVSTLLALGGTLILGAIPFCALGLAAGYLTGPNSAPAIVNLLYLPMAFASGLWIPMEALPAFIKSIAPFLPAYHLAQLALRTIGAGMGAPVWSHVVALAGFTLLGLTVGIWGYHRDEDGTWG
ncbi:MAG TPA: ABC transporter permease [Vicinamibacterales bacterium]|nr:ABC transporter permease [Vicinamibacterales bacterium]